MISRSEIDMLDIRECFRLRYEKSLYNMIKVRKRGTACFICTLYVNVEHLYDFVCVCVYVNQDDTSGDYKRTLLNLCGGDDE